jgi:hypothetical protein
MKQFSFRMMICLSIGVPAIFSACTKNECTGSYTYVYYEPVFKPKAEARADIKSDAPREVKNPGKICLLGNTIFLNEIDKGIHVIDNSNPSRPRNTAFINIPGNIDMAVKGSVLYADMYTDLVTIDITDLKNVKVTSILDTLFPYRNWGRGFAAASQDLVVVDWVRKDTTMKVDCESSRSEPLPFQRDLVFFSALGSSNFVSTSPVGVGGSMARFTIMDNRLYAVSSSQLRVYNISAPASPSFSNRVNIGWNIETIYPFKDRLFIGSQTGMFVFDVGNPDAPAALGQFNHVRTCDPVVADDNHAYVTLRSGSTCGGFTNQLDVVSLKNINIPTLVQTYPMASPHGLSKDGNLLLICHGSSGLKAYDVSDVTDLKTLDSVTGIDAFDVIAYNKIALVTGKTGLYQYSYSNPRALRLLSKIPIAQN